MELPTLPMVTQHILAVGADPSTVKSIIQSLEIEGYTVQQANEHEVEVCLPKPIDTDSLARIVHARLLCSAELQMALINQAYLEPIEVQVNTKVILTNPILKKPGDLITEEWDMMKKHPVAGARIVGSLQHLEEKTRI